MNVDRILETFNRHQVAYLLIGGVNFLFQHAPVLTYDVDFWIEDMPENLDRCERARGVASRVGTLRRGLAAGGREKPGWLRGQTVFCLTSPHGAIDVFRSVTGLESWSACRGRAAALHRGGNHLPGIVRCGHAAMSACMPEGERKRIASALKKRLGGGIMTDPISGLKRREERRTALGPAPALAGVAGDDRLGRRPGPGQPQHAGPLPGTPAGQAAKDEGSRIRDQGGKASVPTVRIVVW